MTEPPIPAMIRDQDREARRERAEQREEAHDQRPRDEEALSSEAVGIRSGKHGDDDAWRAIGRDDEARCARRDVELAGDLGENGRHDHADVHRVEAEEAE